MATKADVSRQLSLKQERAIELLLMGKTATEAAKEVGVSRQTLSEWMNRDPGFQAELNRRRRELWDGVKQRLLRLSDRAIEALEAALQAPDFRVRLCAAVHVLKALGLYGQSYEPHGPTTPEGVLEAQEWQRLASEVLSPSLNVLVGGRPGGAANAP